MSETMDEIMLRDRKQADIDRKAMAAIQAIVNQWMQSDDQEAAHKAMITIAQVFITANLLR